MQPSIYGHFSQPDPCANARSDWRTAKSTSDDREQTYRDYPAKAAAHYAHAAIVLLQLRDDWIKVQKTTDAFYRIYKGCLKNNERDCDYDGSLDDCITPPILRLAVAPMATSMGAFTRYRVPVKQHTHTKGEMPCPTILYQSYQYVS